MAGRATRVVVEHAVVYEPCLAMLGSKAPARSGRHGIAPAARTRPSLGSVVFSARLSLDALD